MRRLLIAGLLAFATANLSADTYPRQPGIDVVHYVFRLGLTDASDEITGETTITVKFVNDNVADLQLDLASMSGGKGMTVLSVRRGPVSDTPGPASDALVFSHQNSRIRVVPPAAGRTGEAFTFTVRYKGVPGDGLRHGSNIHGERTIFADNWPTNARHWLPTVDHPSDKATGEMIVTAPSHYQVVSNGSLVEETDLAGSMRRTHWKQSVPIASWLYTLGVARFATHHAGTVQGVPLQTWVFPQDRETGIHLFEDTSRRAMDFFSTRIGPYSYEKLANIQATGFGGGTEYATAIFYGEKIVSEGRGPVVHEIAHQWFGNAVTERDWDDVWLSEGFATYFALLFTEHDEGRDAFVDGLRRSRDSVLATEKKLPDTPVVHRNLSDMSKVLNGLVYQKGGWILHMLRAEVGTDTFWTAMRHYYRLYRDRNASTAELRAVVEEAAGRDLSWFFMQWLTRPGVPRLTGTWRYDAARKVVDVTVSQSQAAEPWRLSVDVGIAGAPGTPPRIERLAMTGRRAAMSFPSDTKPSGVVLDPNTWLLTDAGAFTEVK